MSEPIEFKDLPTWFQIVVLVLTLVACGFFMYHFVKMFEHASKGNLPLTVANAAALAVWYSLAPSKRGAE